jgi:hypothetical protein
MGAADPAFNEFLREQTARFPQPTYTVGALAKAAQVPRWRIDAAIRTGRLRAYRYGEAANAHWVIERADWLRFRWESSNARPAEPVQQVARPRRGRPPEPTTSKRTPRRAAS